MKILRILTLLLLLHSTGTSLPAQDLALVTGTVSDAHTGKPIAGITVAYEDGASTLTDDKGSFQLRVANYLVSLTISGSGYQVLSLPLKNRKQVHVSLYEAGFTSFYSEVRFPDRTRSLHQSASSLGTVNTGGAWQAGTESPDNYLQGRIPGLTVTRRSGTPGAGANLLLRGYTSLHASNQPLLVVDGVIYDNSSYGNSIIGGHTANPLQNIDIKDISQVTVVKDAVNTYGTKAANGVIFITTEHAKELATRIDFAAYQGMNLTPAQLPVMGTSDYRTYLADLFKSGGYTSEQLANLPYLNDDIASSTYHTYHNNTNWQDQVLRRGSINNYYLKVTGGDDIARYALFMGYGRNSSITDNTQLSSYRTRFNADLNLSPKLTATANLSFSYNEQSLKDQGLSFKTNPIYVSLVKAPLLAVHDIDENGVRSPNLADTDIFGVSNPQSLTGTAKAADKNYRFFGSIQANYRFNSRWQLSSLTGLIYGKIRENTFLPRKGIADDTLHNAVADSRLGSRVQRLFNIYNDTRLNYSASYHQNYRVNAAIGLRYQQTEAEEDYTLGYNSATDNLISVGNGANALRVVGGDIGRSRWLNTYLSIEQQLKQRYIAQFTLTADASSRFGRDISGVPAVGGNKLAVLPALGLSWLLSSEPFMDHAAFIDLLKLRGSYGLTGNDDIGNYDARKYYVSQNLLGLQGLVRGNIGNPGLQWELVKKLNLGVDAALFQQRLQFSVDVYKNNTSKLLLYEPLAAATGFNFVKANRGAMQTSGIDIRLGGRVLNGPLTWDVNLLVSTYRNKITSLSGSSPIITSYGGASYITQEGSAANLFYGWRTKGIYTTHEAAAAEGYSVITANGNTVAFQGGDIRFDDINGDKRIDEADRVVIGNPNPDYTGSIGSSLNYKRWSLDLLFTFSQGNDVFNYTRAVLESASGTNNQLLSVVNRWRADGQHTDIPRVSMGDATGNARFSDRWIEDGSYLRLRTVTLAYDIPVETRLLRYAKVYLSAYNLLTFTRYLGYDPEYAANSSLYSMGSDTGPEPLYKTIQLGLRVGL
ncbi:SusC/RagA family TonB-linked outer membrane protein [Filimonas effusa]|nr:SusC/RagA family TonB-linked outer membrane protein [Filimonas effusa]